MVHAYSFFTDDGTEFGALSLDLALAFGYGASKAALNKFMRLAAGELSRNGIAVRLSLENTGGFWKWNGSTHDW